MSKIVCKLNAKGLREHKDAGIRAILVPRTSLVEQTGLLSRSKLISEVNYEASTGEVELLFTRHVLLQYEDSHTVRAMDESIPTLWMRESIYEDYKRQHPTTVQKLIEQYGIQIRAD